VEDGLTGGVFDNLDALVAGLPRVLSLDRRRIRARTVERFGVDRMVDDYLTVYERLVSPEHARRPAKGSPLKSRYS
jgi:glycosyltransferase involved in cell wall biosynthesis